MPPSFCVSGGRPLKGTIHPTGNKNAALPILAATLLADGPCRIDNVPHIRDVETMLELLAHLGAAVAWTAPNAVEVNTARAEPRELDPKLCARIRASILLAGPMLARFGRVSLPPPGGDVIGRRRVDTHFLALEQLGAEITVGTTYQLEAKKLSGADIFLDEPSVTATENALMAAVAASGTTVLRNAASEPHVQDLARFLRGLGARIDGLGSNTLTVDGGTPLRAAPFTISPDHIEIGSFVGLAAVTNGAVTIDGVRADDLHATLMAFERLGVRPRLDRAKLIVDADQERRIRPDLGGHVPKLEDGPWPAFPADLMSIAIVVASQCERLPRGFGSPCESPPLREQPVADAAVPRMALGEWSERYGVVAGITTRGRAFSLGLWSEENVGQVMSRWRALRAAFRAGFPAVLLSHQVHGTTVQWHRQGQEGWLILDGVDGHATGTPGHGPGVGLPGQASSHLDLRAALVSQARQLGLEEVTVSPWCSAHDREHFFSHRASGGRDGRMIAYLGVPA